VKLIVGLGNTGQRYQDTRHNVGFTVVEALRRRHRGTPWERHLPLYAHGAIPVSGTTVRLLRPLTMMNQSGAALLPAVKRWRVALEDLLLVCDDVNLPLGTLRLRGQGSDGGHRGLASCLEALGTQEVARLRVGIGIKPLPEDLTDFVLSAFRVKERPIIRQAVERAVEACELWATQGVAAAMSRVNVRTSWTESTKP
jgi:PTH1 family peptidyl-tRNA hydrolase